MLDYLDNNKNKVTLHSASLTPFLAMFGIVFLVYLKCANPKNKIIQAIFWLMIILMVLYVLAGIYAIVTCTKVIETTLTTCSGMPGRW